MSGAYTTTPSVNKTTDVTIRNLTTDSYKLADTTGRNLVVDYDSVTTSTSNGLTELKQNISKLDEVVINNMECDESITNVSINQELYVTNIKKNSSQTKINLVDSCQFNEDVVMDKNLQVNGGTLTTTSATLNVGSACQFNEDVVMDKDLQVNGGDITSTSSTLNIGTSVTDLNLSSSSGTTTINNNLTNLKLSVSDVIGSTSSYNSNQVIVLVSPLSELTLTIDSTLNVSGKILIIKDKIGNAGTFNIIVKPEDATIAIDSMGTATINSNYGVVRLFSNGTQWYTF